MKFRTTIAATAIALATHLTGYSVEIGGAAALDVNNWTTNDDAYVQGTADGFAINWENVITNTATANIPNNNFDVSFETGSNYTIGRIFLYNEMLDLSTLPVGGIEKLKWVADFDASAIQNWIPVIAVTDGGTTTFYRSANANNSWNGGDPHEFVFGNANSTFWVDLIGDPIGGINGSRGATNIDFTSTTGMMQFGFIQWAASTRSIISPQLDFTTAIEQFDISVNEDEPPQMITDEKSSADFPNKYDGNEIFDGISFINDWDVPTSADAGIIPSLDDTETILTVTRDIGNVPNGWIQQDNGISPWETGVAAGGSWTAEVRVRLAPDADNAFVLWGANGTERGILQVNTNSVTMFGVPELLDTNDNTDDFHTFRMAYDAGFDRYFVWRDGISLTPNNGRPMQASTGNNLLIVGDCCTAVPMTSIDIDYVRYDTTGSFAPGPDGPPLEITAISYDEDTNLVTLTWRSTPGTFYAIQGSLDMQSWPIDIDDGSLGAPDSDTTTVQFTAEFNPPVPDNHPARAFYRVLLAE